MRLASSTFCLALLALAPLVQAQPASLGTPPGAAAIVDRFKAAVVAGNLEGAAALVSDQAVVFEAGYVERTKAEFVSEHLPADAAFLKQVRTQATRRTEGAAGDAAWVLTEGRSTGTYNGRAIDSITTETVVLRREPAGWRIVHIHSSSRPAQPN